MVTLLVALAFDPSVDFVVKSVEVLNMSHIADRQHNLLKTHADRQLSTSINRCFAVNNSAVRFSSDDDDDARAITFPGSITYARGSTSAEGPDASKAEGLFHPVGPACLTDIRSLWAISWPKITRKELFLGEFNVNFSQDLL